MIGGVVEHDGHFALAVHLAKIDENETIAVETFGLAAETIADALDELKFMATGCRSHKPLLHAWVSPSIYYSLSDWQRHRETFESEFGLSGFPHVEVTHRKFGDGGRTSEHKHLIYLRIGLDGKAVRMSHSGARIEKISRICEVRNGERLTSGRFNDSVIAHLEREGQHDVALAMMRAGLGETRANSAPSSAERAMTDRLGDIASDEVWRRAATAWTNSDSGIAFQTALHEYGLRLAMGDTCVVVISPNGAVHPLLRAINKSGEGVRLRKAVLSERLKGISIPTIKDLPPAEIVDPGVFSITGLNRQSENLHESSVRVQDDVGELPKTEEISAPEVHLIEPALNEDVIDQAGDLTPEQRATLMAFEDLLHHGARQQLDEIRADIERAVDQEIARRRGAELELRIAAEVRRWSRPALGQDRWRDDYKASLAGLPADYGAMLRWVEAREAGRTRIEMKSGVIIDLAPTVAHSSASADESIDLLIGYALRQGWARVRITGGEPVWREKLAVASTRAGLVVTNKNLAGVVLTERRRLEAEQLVEAWWLTRSAALDPSHRETGGQRLIFADILSQIASRPDILRYDWPEPYAEWLAHDIEGYRLYLRERLDDVHSLGIERRPP